MTTFTFGEYDIVNREELYGPSSAGKYHIVHNTCRDRPAFPHVYRGEPDKAASLTGHLNFYFNINKKMKNHGFCWECKKPYPNSLVMILTLLESKL